MHAVMASSLHPGFSKKTCWAHPCEKVTPAELSVGTNPQLPISCIICEYKVGPAQAPSQSTVGRSLQQRQNPMTESSCRKRRKPVRLPCTHSA